MRMLSGPPGDVEVDTTGRRWNVGQNCRWTYDESTRTYIKEWSAWYYETWRDEERQMEYPVIWHLTTIAHTGDGNERVREVWTWDYA